jgi:DNA adenine methylase
MGVAAPFLRWAGGKRWLSRKLVCALRADFKSYHEPFLGSGALFFALRPSKAHLSDSNRELINAFRVVRDKPDDLVHALRSFRYNREEYYRIRAESPSGDIDRAARFIFLNRTCWNGLYRVNRAGTFNVPYGRRVRPAGWGHERILEASELLQDAEIECRDFEDSLRRVRPGEFVFADPPYTVAHGNNGFILYNEKIFSWGDQERLARVLMRATDRGVHFVLTNADHPSIRDLYSGFELRPIARSSIIAADSINRRHVSELLISNCPLVDLDG